MLSDMVNWILAPIAAWATFFLTIGVGLIIVFGVGLVMMVVGWVSDVMKDGIRKGL